MGWDYAWKAGPVGALEDLEDYCRFVRVPNEWSTGRRGSNPVVQYQHGEYSTPRKFVRAANFMLELGLRYTDDVGAVVHSDGRPGHAYENLSHLKRLFGGLQGALVRVERTSPEQGTVHIDCEQLGEARPSQGRSVFGWPLHAPKPFWQGASDDSNATPTWTVGGDAPAGTLVIRIVGGTDTRVTHDDTAAYVEIAGALPAGGVDVDVEAGTVLRVSGGADWSQHLVVNEPWWMELDPGANAVSVSGGGTVTASWVEQWR